MHSKISHQISTAATISILFTLLAACGGCPQPSPGDEAGKAAKATLNPCCAHGTLGSRKLRSKAQTGATL
ncbi:MAG TPA: hypothetical protein VFK30_10735 [Anaerolineae bacterium]|nr:hypothetical protein [Anaerolineae bacterium]